MKPGNMTIKNSALPLLLLFLTAACHDKAIYPDGNPRDPIVNQWVYSNMQTWYYWNSKLPTQPDTTLTPSAFFNSLLYSYDSELRPDGDRFSWIQANADDLLASLSGESKTTGMDFRLVRYSGSSNYYGQVIYVLNDSPADKAGFRRGDFFTKINGQGITASNYANLAYSSSKKTYTVGRLNDDNDVEDTGTTREVTPVTFQEDPVHFDTLYTIGTHKIAYLVYNQFIPGPNSGSSTTAYDDKLDNIIANFKNAGVNNLILDLRYNPGGYVSSANNLASLIGKGITNNSVFYIKEYNPTITPELEKKYGKDFFSEKFKTKSQNIGNQLQNLIILTSTNTASASELLINGLRPFMPVTLIGEQTVGKNVGSITLTDATRRIKWGIQPIVSKSFNSLRESNYTKGFTPDISKSEGQQIYPFGNVSDPLLGAALEKITGSPLTRRAATPDSKQVVPVSSSIARKAGGSNMFFR
jgi:carboxyl-terminal processing protease